MTTLNRIGDAAVKGAAKPQVAVEHSKLADGATVGAKMTFWKETLARLAARLER